MSYYNVCPTCGANLDPGERCGCTYVLQAFDKGRIIAKKGLDMSGFADLLSDNEKEEDNDNE